MKKVFTLVFLLSFLVVSQTLFAADPAPSGSTLVASVNFRDVSIVSQNENEIQVSFSLVNGAGIQNGVKYGVQLVSRTGGKTTIVDEKVFDEQLFLSENSTTQRTVTYDAPATLSGTYDIVLVSRNEKNFPFAFHTIQGVTLTASKGGIVLDSSTCTVLLGTMPASTATQITISDPESKITLMCMIINTSDKAVSVVPRIATNEFGPYGKSVAVAPVAFEPTMISAGEKKQVSLQVPLAAVPGSYVANISFASGSGSASVRYLLQGGRASILNMSLDRSTYEKGDTANLSVVWNAPITDVTVVATLKSGFGGKCAEPVEKTVSGAVAEIAFPVTSSCNNPSASVILKNSLGETIAQDDVSSASHVNKNVLMLVVGIVLILLIMALVAKRRNHKGTSGSVPMAVLLPLIVLMGVGLISIRSAEASTYMTGSDVITVVDVDPAVYNPNADVSVTWYVENLSATYSLPITLRAVNDIGLGLSNPQHVFLPQTLFAPGQRSGGGSPTVDSLIFDAPAASGTYNIVFETGVLEPVYIRTTPQGVTSWTTTGQMCNEDVTLLHSHTSSILVEFFTDQSMTTPLNVTGMGFRLLIDTYNGAPAGQQSNPTTSVTGILTGTSYTISPGISFDQEPVNVANTQPPWGFGCIPMAWAPITGKNLHMPALPFESWPSSITVPYRFPATIPIPSIFAEPLAVYTGEQTMLSWSGGGASSCTGSGFSTGGRVMGIEGMSGFPPAYVTVTPGNNIFSINCSNVVGSASASVTVPLLPPGVSLSASPDAVNEGQNTTLTWSTIGGATSCTSSDFSTGGATSGSVVVTPPTGSPTYNISCTGPTGTGTADATVQVYAPTECYDEFGGLYYCPGTMQCSGAPSYSCQ